MFSKNCAHQRAGFTITEIIVVIFIVGVLAALALPRYTTAVEHSRAGEGMHILDVLRGAQEIYKYENGAYTAVLTDLDVTIPTPTYFNDPTVATSDPIASIARNTGDYTLSITAAGSITCNGTVATCAAIGCPGGACN